MSTSAPSKCEDIVLKKLYGKEENLKQLSVTIFKDLLNKIILLMHACKKLHSLRIKLNGNFDWIFLKGLKNLSLKILKLKSFTHSKFY